MDDAMYSTLSDVDAGRPVSGPLAHRLLLDGLLYGADTATRGDPYACNVRGLTVAGRVALDSERRARASRSPSARFRRFLRDAAIAFIAGAAGALCQRLVPGGVCRCPSADEAAEESRADEAAEESRDGERRDAEHGAASAEALGLPAEARDFDVQPVPVVVEGVDQPHAEDGPGVVVRREGGDMDGAAVQGPPEGGVGEGGGEVAGVD